VQIEYGDHVCVVSRVARLLVESRYSSFCANTLDRTTERLFVTQGDERVDSRGAASGHVACGDGDNDKQHRYADDREWIGRANAVEKICEIACEEERTGETKRKANENHDQALTKDEAKNVGGRRAESHTNADFAGALRDKIGNDTVNADRGEDQGEGGEDGEERHIGAWDSDRVFDALLHGGDVKNRLPWIGGGKLGANGRNEPAGVLVASDDDRSGVFAKVRDVDLRIRIVVESSIVDITHDTDNSAPRALGSAEADAFRERGIGGEKVLGERRADDDRPRFGREIG